MSYSFRERLRIKLRQKQIKATEEEIQNIEKHIEEYCSEADRRCHAIDPNKAVDEIIDNMNDDKFLQFAQSILDELKRRKAKQKKKKKTKQTTQEITEETKEEEKPIEVEST